MKVAPRQPRLMAPARRLPHAPTAKLWRPPTSRTAPTSSTARFTKGHDLQSCKKVEQLVELQKAEYERSDKEKVQGGARGSGTKHPGRGGRRGNAKQRQGD